LKIDLKFKYLISTGFVQRTSHTIGVHVHVGIWHVNEKTLNSFSFSGKQIAHLKHRAYVHNSQ